MKQPDLFLDSGAFSAWTRGHAITVKEYAEYILANVGVFSIVASLDVIPSSMTTAAVIKAAEESWANFLELRTLLKSAGITPIPTFHYGEPFKFLDRILAEPKVPMLALGGIAKRSRAERLTFFDLAWDRLTDAAGWPIRQVHGFGMTSIDLMQRYPWYSVDSTAWVTFSRFGTVVVPLNGKVHKIVFSDQSPSVRLAGKHFFSYSKSEKIVIQKYLLSIGLTVKAVTKDFNARDVANIRFFLDLEKEWETKPYQRTGSGFGL